MATFRRVGDRWKAIIRDNTGTYLRSQTFTRKEDAKVWARGQEARREVARARENPAYATTVGELLDLYGREEPVRAAERAPELRWWRQELGGDTVLADISTQTVNKVLQRYRSGDAMVAAKGGKLRPLGRKRSGASANRRLAYLSAAFKVGMDHGVTAANPAAGGKRYAESPERERVLTPDEMTRLFEAARQSEWPRLYLRLLMAATCGGRPGEVERVRWQDVNWQTRTAVVPPDPKGRRSKTGVVRTLFLTEPVVEELRRFRPGKGEDESGLIFGRDTAPSERGRKRAGRDAVRRPYTYRKVWLAALTEAGLPRSGPDKVVPYHLRHTYATTVVEHLLSGEVEESAARLAAAKLLGHSSLQTTKRYFHPDSAALRRVNDAALGRLAGPKAIEIAQPPALPSPAH